MNDATSLPSSRSSNLPRLIFLIAFLVLAGWLVWKVWWGLSHVSTDNAQIEAHIVPVMPKVGGFVTAVQVSDHQAVKAGDLLVQILSLIHI